MIFSSSNLAEENNVFLQEELDSALRAAVSHGIKIPHINIEVFAEKQSAFQLPGRFAEFCDEIRQSERFRIERQRNTVRCIGGAYPGVLRAFYGVLRNSLGIRWYGLSEKDVYFTRNNVPYREEGVPKIPFRGIECCLDEFNTPALLDKFFRWMARSSWNMLMFNADKLEKNKEAREFIGKMAPKCGIEVVEGEHVMETLLPPELIREHPEYFGLYGNGRRISGKVQIPEHKKRYKVHIQPCLSNPDCRRHIATNVANYIERHPNIKIYALWPHDGINNWCRCKNCRSKAPYAMMHELASEVLSKVSRPVYIQLIAYANLLNVPSGKVSQEARIHTLFCPYMRNYKHHFYEPGFPESKLRLGTAYPGNEHVYPQDDREYGILLKRWLAFLKKIDSDFGVFSYYQLAFRDERGLDDRSRYMRQTNPIFLQEEIRELSKNGIKVFIDCSWPFPGLWPDANLNAVYGDILWDPESNIIPGLKEFYSSLNGLDKIICEISEKLDLGVRSFNDCDLPAKLKTARKGTLEYRIKLWVEYVKKASLARTLKLEGKGNEAAEHEKAIIELVRHNQDYLKDYTSVDWLVKLATWGNT
ncbi:MAG: hypothetical protein A2X49_13585 [Lentisphaerae bacterium GWF2_52_8]|nr:MAG: hypothetical protein A2X49_13585 [Lentisphaerae bacterium GWF2_52_8]